MAKQTAHIEDWDVVRNADNTLSLEGRVSDHPHQDTFKAERQRTSPVILLDQAKSVAETRNTHYTLGKRREEPKAQTTRDPA